MKSWMYAMMIVTAGSLVACSSSKGHSTTGSSSNVGGDGGGGGAGGGNGGGGNGGGVMTTTTTTTTGTMMDMCTDGTDCTTCADNKTCGDCCVVANSDANDALTTLLVNNCACADASACKTTCAPGAAGDPDICADPLGMTTQACVDCINMEIKNQGQCVKDTVMTCSGDANCAPVLMCFQGCPQ